MKTISSHNLLAGNDFTSGRRSPRLNPKIRRVHFLFSRGFRGPCGDFLAVGRVDKRKRRLLRDISVSLMANRRPGTSRGRVSARMCMCVCLSVIPEWSTVTSRPSLRSASMSGHSVAESRSGSISRPVRPPPVIRGIVFLKITLSIAIVLCICTCGRRWGIASSDRLAWWSMLGVSEWLSWG